MAGCANSDICNVHYLKASPKDTELTKAQALAQNEFLQKQGCPIRFSPIVTGAPEAVAPAPSSGLAAIEKLIGGSR